MTECPAKQSDSQTNAVPAGEAGGGRAHRFAQIVDRYQGALLRYVGRMAGCRQDQVEDVVQECFLRLHRAWGPLAEPPMERVGAWLFTVAHNLTMDLLRKAGRHCAAPDGPVPAADAAEELNALGQITQSEAAEAALAAMDRLPPGHKQVVLMKVLEGLTFRQIAKATGQSLGSVNRRLNEALDMLARQLRQSGHL